MEYRVDLRRIPKKNNDINNIRCIVLGIYLKFKVTAKLLKVSEARYETYLDALMDSKVIMREKGSKGYQIESFIIFDEAKLDQYKKTAFRKMIEKHILPFFNAAKDLKDIIK